MKYLSVTYTLFGSSKVEEIWFTQSDLMIGTSIRHIITKSHGYSDKCINEVNILDILPSS